MANLIYQIKLWTFFFALVVMSITGTTFIITYTPEGIAFTQARRPATSQDQMRADFLTVMSDISQMIPLNPKVENTNQSLMPMRDFMRLKEE
ncbi:MAG: hypothetical protein KAS59_00755 [Alphaproteobacteria bacterium]|nr:hypothetical protein [Alphaproteobacteria bacterium]